MTESEIELSLIIPFYNEVENLAECYERMTHALDPVGKSYEMLFIDDGSTDESIAVVRLLAERDPRVKVIQFYRNFGQTAAIAAGIRFARGRVVLPMDADNQNDPRDIPKLLAKMDEGYDVVSGWRKDRKDTYLTRILPSKIANALISKVTGVALNDYGCTLKAYKAEYLKPVALYGEMHRFIPAYARLTGAKITEVPVNHLPRTKGQSKYGLSRTFKVVLDLMTIKFLGAFATKPIYLFGSLGFFLLFASLVLAGWVIRDKFALGVFVHRNPLFMIATLFAILGVLFVMMGLLAELLIRIYHESTGRPTYLIRETRNLNDAR